MSEESLHQKCKWILKEPEIRFAGFLDMMGNLIVGLFSDGIKPLKNEEERKKCLLKRY